MGAPLPSQHLLAWLSAPAELQSLPSLCPQLPVRWNSLKWSNSRRRYYTTSTCLLPVTVPPTPAEPYEAESDWWVVSTESAALSAALSNHEDASAASPCLHKYDASVQLPKSEETKPNNGWFTCGNNSQNWKITFLFSPCGVKQDVFTLMNGIQRLFVWKYIQVHIRSVVFLEISHIHFTN